MLTFALYNRDDSPDTMRISHNTNLNFTAQHTHTDNFCEIFFVLNGNATHCINDGIQILSSKQLSFVRDTDVHYYQNYYSEDIEWYNLHISMALLEEELKALNIDKEFFYEDKLSPIINIPITAYSHLVELFEKYAGMESGKEKIILYRTLLRDILYLFVTESKNFLSDIPQWFMILMSEIQKKELFIDGLDKIVERSGYTREYLSRCFKKYLNLTPTEYINKLRIEYSFKLITEQNFSSTDACHESGFNNYSYFAKLFKKAYHNSPHFFKNNNM